MSNFTQYLHKTGSAHEYKLYIKERSRNHCCRGKATNITYSEYVFVVLGIQHAMRMRRIVIYGFSGSKILFFQRHFIFLSDFNKNLNFLPQKIRPEGDEVFHVERQKHKQIRRRQ